MVWKKTVTSSRKKKKQKTKLWVEHVHKILRNNENLLGFFEHNQVGHNQVAFQWR